MHPTDRRPTQPSSLAEQLYRLRKETAGLTGDQLADALGWGSKTGRTKVSKIENGKQTPTVDEVRAWADACGHPEAADELLTLLAQAQAEHRQWKGRLRHGQAPVQEEFGRRAAPAKRIRNATPLIIPSFIQTAGYARAIMTQVSGLWGTTDVDAAVEARMRRQEALYDRSKTFEFVITEAALRLLPCPPQVMLGQLDRLLSLDLDNVTLGIIPMGIQLAVMPYSDFLLLDDVAIVESSGGEDEVGEEESSVYARIFDEQMAEAATGEGARRLITSAAESLRD